MSKYTYRSRGVVFLNSSITYVIIGAEKVLSYLVAGLPVYAVRIFLLGNWKVRTEVQYKDDTNAQLLGTARIMYLISDASVLICGVIAMLLWYCCGAGVHSRKDETSSVHTAAVVQTHIIQTGVLAVHTRVCWWTFRTALSSTPTDCRRYWRQQ